MKTLELEGAGLTELHACELEQTQGGFLPLIAIGVCWGVMLACSAVALGMQAALNECE